MGSTGDQDKIETHSNRFPVDKSSVESLNIRIKGGQVCIKNLLEADSWRLNSNNNPHAMLLSRYC